MAQSPNPTLRSWGLTAPVCQSTTGAGAGEGGATCSVRPLRADGGSSAAPPATVRPLYRPRSRRRKGQVSSKYEPLAQGNRVLSEEDLAQVVLVPSGVEPLALNAYFQGAFVFQPVVPNLPQRGQVLRSMVLAHSALVFPKGHVQGPVQRVFDAPVASDGSQELFCWGWQAADVVAGLT